MRIYKILVISVAGLLVAASVAAHRNHMRRAAAAEGQKDEAVVDAKGNLRVPDNYQTSYQFLGSWAIANEKGKGSQDLHVVYASPGTIAAYRKSGRFPDGAVLVKEVFQAATRPMETGTVSHAQKLKGWFVMVKDSKGSHPGNTLWGDGWGWSWFDADNPSKTTSANYKIECLSCHVPVRGTDLVYIEGYPPLSNSH